MPRRRRVTLTRALRRAARRVCVLLAIAVTAVVAAGCGAERPEQQAARQLVETHIVNDAGYEGTVRCTRNPRPWFVGRATKLFFCTARRDDGDCDLYRVSVGDTGATVTLERRRAGCVLPL